MAARHQVVYRRPGIPIHVHPLDPVSVHQRAAEIGLAAADGALEDVTIAALIDVLTRAATKQGYSGDLNGLRTRLWWTVRDSAGARERARRWTEIQVRRAAIAAIVTGLPFQEIMHAAQRANRSADPPLPDGAVATLVLTEIAIEARRARCDCCSRARPGRG